MARIGFVTAADLSRFFPSAEEPHLTHDDRVAAEHLRARGHDVVPVVWGRDLNAKLDLAVVRSPWDYQDSAESSAQFFSWLEDLDGRVPVANPVSLMRWNLDKRYLADLASAGVPIVPTEFFGPEQPLSRGLLRDRAARAPIVLKPSISAAAHDTFLIDSPAAVDDLSAHNGRVPHDVSLDAWRAGRTFLLQPFLEEVRERGEWSIVFIDGEPTHAVLKRPRAGDWRVQDELGGSVRSATPTAELIEVARIAHHAIPSALSPDSPPLYARVDLIETASGPRLSELELIEPELFFKSRGERDGTPNLDALSRFEASIAARAAGDESLPAS